MFENWDIRSNVSQKGRKGSLSHYRLSSASFHSGIYKSKVSQVLRDLVCKLKHCLKSKTDSEYWDSLLDFYVIKVIHLWAECFFYLGTVKLVMKEIFMQAIWGIWLKRAITLE